MAEQLTGSDALLEDYKLKLAFLTDHRGRMLTQFQVLLTLQVVVATALIVTQTGGLSAGAKWIALLEALLSGAWLVYGRHGYFRAKQLGLDADVAGRAWATSAGLGGPTFRTAGEGDGPPRVAILAPGLLTIFWAVMFVVFVVQA